MNKEAKTWQVEKLREVFGSINFPDYQREPNVWSRDAKQRLVDSMARRFDIASIYIYRDKYGAMDCVDGRQRLGAIMSFLGGNPMDGDDGFEFRVLNEIFEEIDNPWRSLDNKTFGQIEVLARSDGTARKFIQRFQEYPLTVVFLSDSSTEEEFNLQFARLNLGTIINSGEKLHAMVGALRDACFLGVGRHPFLEETKVPTRRYSREQLATQVIAQVFAWEEGGERGYGRARHFDLQRLFKRYTSIGEEESKWIERASDVMRSLHAAFQDMSALRNRAIVVSTVLLAYEVDARVGDTARTVAAFVEDFVRCLRWQIGKGLDVDEECRYLVEFQRHVTQASVEKPAVEARAREFREGLARWKREGRLRGDAAYRKRTGRDPREERGRNHVAAGGPA